MQDDDEKTEPGRPSLLVGPPEARAIAELATTVSFYARRLELLSNAIRRNMLTDAQSLLLARDLRETGKEFLRGAEAVNRARQSRNRGSGG